jgi:hypothetical protein
MSNQRTGMLWMPGFHGLFGISEDGAVVNFGGTDLQVDSLGEVAGFTFTDGAATLASRTLKFESLPGSNVAMQFDTGASDLISDFYFNLSNTANPGSPTRPNPVMQWGYNLAPGGGRVDETDTAIGFGLEGHYEPSEGTDYTESHLYFVDKDGSQHRPWSWRINKDDTADWANLIYASGTGWFKPGTDDTYASLTAAADGGGFQIITDGLGTTNNGISLETSGGQGVIIQKTGPDSRYLLLSGWSAVGVQCGLDATRLGAGGSVSSTTFLNLAAGTTASSALRLVQGVAPSSPVDGDIWREDNTDTGLKIRVNGVTKTITLS